MDIPWEDVQLFLAVAETGSVSGAARQLRIGQPTVSRRLAQLEYALGTKLFLRTVGGTQLTPAGEQLVAPARKMAEWAGEVGRVAERTDSTPSGLVRVTASPYTCFDFLAPLAGWLRNENPGLRLEVLAGTQYLDLVRGEADLALRPRPPTQPDLKRVASFEFESAVFVSKELAATLPRKPHFKDLPWIAWAPPMDQVTPNPQLEEMIPGFVAAFTADNFLVQLAAAEAGAGAMVLPLLHHRFSRKTNLVPLPVDLGPYRKGTAHLVCARSALDIPRIRRVAEILERELRGAKPLTGPR